MCVCHDDQVFATNVLLTSAAQCDQDVPRPRHGRKCGRGLDPSLWGLRRGQTPAGGGGHGEVQVTGGAEGGTRDV